MSKGIRVYELARELDVNSKDILHLLQERMNIELNNHMSTINDQVAAKVRRLIAGDSGPAPAAERSAQAGRTAGTAGSGAARRASATGADLGRPQHRPSAPAAPAGRGPARPPAPAPMPGHGPASAPPARMPLREPGPVRGPVPGGRSPAPAGPRTGLPATGPATARPAPPAADRAGLRPAQAPAGLTAPRPAGSPTATPAARPAAPAAAQPGFHPGPRPAPRPAAPAPSAGTTAPGRAPGGAAPRPEAPRPEAPRPAPPRPGLSPQTGRAPASPPAAPRGPAASAGTVAATPATAVSATRPPAQATERPAPGADRGTHRPLGPSRQGPGRDGAAAAPGPRILDLQGPILVGELAARLGTSASEVIKRLLAAGVVAGINHQLDHDRAVAVAQEFGFEVAGPPATAEGDQPKTEQGGIAALLGADEPERMAPRSAVVTVLGHVDHGKTTLLDAIRETRVAASEAGGITQHIGASVVEYEGRRLVFLDTPGHEAFTAMRARGARVTDIAVLVVAADDGVMPQTVEAISHARAAGVPVVVALNKVDRPGANQDRVLQQLADNGLVPEAWGGDIIVVPVSAIRRQGIPELMEMLLLVADMQDLKADPDRNAVGTVVEARVARGRGPVATVLVQSGTLRQGNAFVAGRTFGRIRAMMDDRGRPVREAGPATPVEILGLDGLPEAGDIFEVLADERTAREIAASRQSGHPKEGGPQGARAVTLAEFHQTAQETAEKELRIILKADVQGSLEALRATLERLRNEEARVTVLHGGVGPVNESDVMLAAASGAVIVGFNVRPDGGAEREASRQSVEIRTHRIIYEVIDEMQAALNGMLAPKFVEVTAGRAEVRATFKVPGVGTVAGCYVTEGEVRRGAKLRVVRGGTIVHEGSVASLKRFQEDVREVAAGYECGLGIERWNDVKEGDMLEVLEQREVPR